MPVLLNGRVHDWVSAILNLGAPIGKVPATLQSITYPDHAVEKKLQYGTGKNPVGYTRGTYVPGQLELEFLAAEWDTFRNLLGPGYMEIEIPGVSITYVDAAAGLVPRTDTFLGNHIVKEMNSVTQGTDPLKTKVTFQPNQMVLNGVPAVTPTTA